MLRSLRLLALLGVLTLSVLPADARWVRIAVERTGLYVLSSSQLRAWGFADPSRVGVYGSGGAMLPEELDRLTRHKLTQTPLYIEGDKRYFYAQGTTRWEYLPEKDFFSHETNPYSRHAYYLLSDQGTPAVMEEVTLTPPSPPLSSEDKTYTAVYLHEEERYTPSNTGRHLFGEDLTRTPNLTFSLPADLQATALRARLAYMAYPQAEDATLSLNLKGEKLLSSTLTLEEMKERMPAGGYHIYGRRKLTAPSPSVTLPTGQAPQLTLSYTTPKTIACLDYLEANISAPLVYSGTGQLLFARANPSGRPQTFSLTAPSDTHLFRIDTGQAPQHLTSGQTFVSEATSTLPRYLALRLNQAYTPTFVGEEEAPTALAEAPATELFIITTDALRLETERLASYYRGKGKSVLVATQQQLFNELNGGTPDASVYRLACYHLYQQAMKQGLGADFQLLLFGDGAQDNRRLSEGWQSQELQSTELLLTYQSRNSLDLDSYTSDDYFAMLDPTEDHATPIDSDADHLASLTMTIGVGRFPVRTAEEARALVDKTIRYSEGADLGAWRTRATFVADNGDSNRHLRQSLAVSEALGQVAPQLFIQPVYLADYPRQSSGGQVTVPGAKRAFQQALREGSLLVTYTGHGGPHSWTDEQLLTTADVRRFSHTHLPLWLTATCDFAPFDAPTTSAGEEVVLHPTSGGIALLGTTRIAWDLPNQAMATAVLQALFTPDGEGKLRPLGSAIREAKNKLRRQSYPINRLNFSLLGSPLLTLPLPTEQTALTRLEEQAIRPDTRLTLSPGAPLRLEGALLGATGKRDTTFSGQARIRLYDSRQRYETIDNFNYGDTSIPPVSYTAYKELLLDEEVSVEGGIYRLTQPLPHAVNETGSALRLEVYAYDAVHKRDAFGAFTQIFWSKDASDQPIPPTAPIQILSLTLGGQASLPQLGNVSPGASLDVLLEAPQGINRSAQALGHLPLLILDEQEALTFDLREHLRAEAGSTGRYRLTFPLPSLPAGAHQLRLRLWDTTGQLTEQTADFTLLPGLRPEISSAKLYPTSPHLGERLTLDVVSPSREGSQELEVSCYDYTGKRLSLQTIPARPFTLGQESYDLTSLTASLPAGSYLLRLRLHSGSLSSELHTLPFRLLP